MSTVSTITLDSRTIAVSDSGGTGYPLLLAHGFGLDSSMFGGQADLAPSSRVIAWDAPGHGASPVGPEPFTFWDLARTQIELLDALRIERAVVGGVSQGGFIALRTALVAPGRVSGLVLMDTESAALGAEDAQSYGRLFAALAEYGPTPELTTGLAAQIVGDHPAAEKWAGVWRERGVPLGAPVDCLVHRDDVTDRLSGITAPALVLCGENDHSIPRERQERMRRGLTGAGELHVVPGAGHSPALTHPDAVNRLLESFLDDVLGT
ncbi:alpha/beta hydrolase [Pseudonocardia nematodicida]|uniref:Alpha/beta hydrolase n=1 Tax=Pseudonocardia nematodicida TaxID=1206997 RepID=A0ABV1KGL4_9PSEU